MKKLLILLFALTFVFLFAACDKNVNDDKLSSLMSDIQSEIKDELDVVNTGSLTTSPTDNVTSKTLITAAKAKEIALVHAGLKENQIFDFDIELDREHGAVYYEIDFETKGYEYEYDIDATTGKIIKNRKEINN